MAKAKVKLEKFLWMLLFAGFIALLLFVIVSSILQPFSKPLTLLQRDWLVRVEQNRLARAKAKWEAKNINNYNLQVEVSLSEWPDEPTCLMNIFVRDKTQITISQNTCLDTNGGGYLPQSVYPLHAVFSLSPETIDGVFKSLKGAIQIKSSAPNGIECDGFYAYTIEYDFQLGYPRSVKVSHPLHFGSAFPCTLLSAADIYPEYRISITPLP